jgi:hypothetical protein
MVAAHEIAARPPQDRQPRFAKQSYYVRVEAVAVVCGAQQDMANHEFTWRFRCNSQLACSLLRNIGGRFQDAGNSLPSARKADYRR